MKKIVVILLVSFAFNTLGAHADNYLGGGIGLTEACYTDYEPSFSGGDCDRAGLLLRSVMGHEWNDYLAWMPVYLCAHRACASRDAKAILPI